MKTLCYFIFFAYSMVSYSQPNLDSYRWQKRLLIFLYSKEQSTLWEKRIAKQYADQKELSDRKLEILRYTYSDWKTDLRHKEMYTPDSSRELTVLLIGLDGGIKDVVNELEPPSYFYNQIDKMPMRRAELNKQK